MHNFPRPGQAQQGHCCRKRASEHKGYPLSPQTAAVVTSDSDIWLDKSTGEWPGYPHEGEQGLAHA